MPRRLLVEPLLTDRGGFPIEYKFFMFNGLARLVMVRANYGDLPHQRIQSYCLTSEAWCKCPDASVTSAGRLNLAKRCLRRPRPAARQYGPGDLRMDRCAVCVR